MVLIVKILDFLDYPALIGIIPMFIEEKALAKYQTIYPYFIGVLILVKIGVYLHYKFNVRS